MGVRTTEHPERMIIMSMRGGYQIIDLKNVPLYSGFLKDNVENHIHVKGIYYNLYHSNAKMILLSGLNMDNKPHRDYEIIPYEEDNEFKAILKKVWNTDKHLVYTYFLHIAEDDDVYITYEELDYDRVDKTFNDKSDIAIANSTVTKKVKALDAEDLTFVKLDGSRHMTGSLDFLQNQIKNATLSSCKLGNTLDAANYEIINLASPTTLKSAVTREYVNMFTTGYRNPVKLSSSSIENEMNTLSAIVLPNIVFFSVEIVSSEFKASKTFTSQDIIDIKGIYSSMGLSYDKTITGTGYFIGRGLEDKAINITANVTISISHDIVNVTLKAESPQSQSAMASISTYGGAIAIHA